MEGGGGWGGVAGVVVVTPTRSTTLGQSSGGEVGLGIPVTRGTSLHLGVVSAPPFSTTLFGFL